MSNSDNLPFEVNYERVKQSLVRTVNQVAESEQMPSSLMIIILENVLQEFKLNTYSTIIGNYDISMPDGAESNQELNSDQQTSIPETIDLTSEEIKKGDTPIAEDINTKKSS